MNENWYKDLDTAKNFWELAYGFLLLVVLFQAFRLIPENYQMLSLMIGLGMSGIGTLFSVRYVRKVFQIEHDHKEKLSDISDKISFVRRATPGDSFLKEAEKYKLNLKDIDTLYLQTGDICNEYMFKNLIPQLQANSAKFDKLKLVCAGYGDVTAKSKFKCNSATYDEFEIINVDTKEKLTEHFNVIKMKNGDMYVWYEPIHETPPLNNSPALGAFFSKVREQERDRAMEIYNSALIQPRQPDRSLL